MFYEFSLNELHFCADAGLPGKKLEGRLRFSVYRL